MYHYAGNNPIKYTDPDGRSPQVAALTISGSAGMAIAAKAVLAAGIKTVGAALASITPVGWAVITVVAVGGIAYAAYRQHENSKATEQSIPIAKAESKTKKNDTVIYRWGNGNGVNLTPRDIDINGLSYSTEKPVGKKYTSTTINTVNSTGVLMAIQDSENHVSVMPTDISKMPEWQASRSTANENPHLYTKILQSISIKE